MEPEPVFTLEQARALLPWIREACEEAEIKIQRLRRLDLDQEENQSKTAEIIHHWAETVAKLGAAPKGPFTVDFNSGSDYFCWEYPEQDLYFRHDYDQGYKGRYRIEESS